MNIRSEPNLISDLKSLYSHFSNRRKFQSILFIGLIVVAAISEIFSIGIMIPFLSAVFQPITIYESSWAQPFIGYFKIASADELPLAMTCVFIIVITLAATIRVIHTWVLVMLAHRIGADLSQKAFLNTISLPYEELISKNSNNLISTLFVKLNLVVIQVIAPCFSLITALILSVSILSALIFIEPYISFAIFAGLIILYGFSILILRSRMIFQGATINTEQNKVIRFLQEALGSVRDMILDNSQIAYSHLYKNSDTPLRLAQAKIEFYRLSPRHIIEAMVMIIFSLIALFLVIGSNKSPEASIATMGALAMGGIKLLPIFQNGYAGWAGIKSHHSLVSDTLDLLNEEHSHELIVAKSSLEFNNHIQLNNISFSYQGAKELSLQNINFTISKGSRIGIIGATGSGKTTLVDIIMGLLTLKSGEILVDGIQLSDSNTAIWQKKISHVPQSIFLTDTSIARNISLGIPDSEADMNKVIEAARGAQIHDVISSWPLGYETIVGERGIKISGGELQRIGLARALYKDPEILVLDEATSALDEETEKKVMSYIYNLKQSMTIIIIAHRTSTLDHCSDTIELSNGQII